jgi:hypothetical protein
MSYTHRDNVQRTFRVPFGPWLIPTVGGLLCIVMMAGTSPGTGIRFLVWTGIGQIVYFAYGYRHSKKRKMERDESMISETVLVSTIGGSMMELAHKESESESDLAAETTEHEMSLFFRL